MKYLRNEINDKLTELELTDVSMQIYEKDGLDQYLLTFPSKTEMQIFSLVTGFQSLKVVNELQVRICHDWLTDFCDEVYKPIYKTTHQDSYIPHPVSSR